ncbi:MAG TPA: GtrA family protein [Solirubrobacteraceae bacterium]|jgi:putative flippase GtrA
MTARVVSGQFARFAVVGASNTVLTLAVYTLLLWAGLPYIEAFAPAFAAGAVSGYTLNRLWTFDVAAARSRGLMRYASVQLAGLALNAVLLIAFVELLGMQRLMAQVVAVGCVSLLTFAASRRWVFRDGGCPTG